MSILVDNNAPHALDLIYLCDCSGSMAGAHIAAVNTAIARVLPELVAFETAQADVHLCLGVICFANTARWHVSAGTPVNTLVWYGIADTGGVTSLGQAYDLLRTQFCRSAEGFPGVFVLISDGMPTDEADAALGVLLASPVGAEAQRFSIGIGSEVDDSVLAGFAGQNPRRFAQVSSALEMRRSVSEFTFAGIQAAMQQAQERL